MPLDDAVNFQRKNVYKYLRALEERHPQSNYNIATSLVEKVEHMSTGSEESVTSTRCSSCGRSPKPKSILPPVSNGFSCTTDAEGNFTWSILLNNERKSDEEYEDEDGYQWQ